MGRFWEIVLLILSGIGIACAQQTGPSTQSPTTDEQPARVKVYAAGPGVTAPELLPLNLPPFPVAKCKKKVDGTVEISLLVDANGQPRNLMLQWKRSDPAQHQPNHEHNEPHANGAQRASLLSGGSHLR